MDAQTAQNLLDAATPCCRHCAFWMQEAPDEGVCHALPPTALLCDDGPASVRPIVDALDPACSLFRARH